MPIAGPQLYELTSQNDILLFRNSEPRVRVCYFLILMSLNHYDQYTFLSQISRTRQYYLLPSVITTSALQKMRTRRNTTYPSNCTRNFHPGRLYCYDPTSILKVLNVHDKRVLQTSECSKNPSTYTITIQSDISQQPNMPESSNEA
ncbi:Adenine phosphoribosyltransferase, partial [Fusarium oxysporum f. sp. albedinis]